MSASFSLPISIDRQSGQSYQSQLVSQIEELITSGRLCPGDGLPSINAMVASLGVSKNTVLGAFDKLAGAGYIQGERGRGYFVAHGAVATQPEVTAFSISSDIHPKLASVNPLCLGSGVYIDPPRVPIRHDFKLGRPSIHAFPRRKWSRLSNDLLMSGLSMAEYAPAEGLWGLRMNLADYLRVSRAMQIEPEQVIIVAGIQEALSLLAAHFLSTDSQVIVESPCYSGFFNLLELHNCHIQSIEVDDQGLNTNALPAGAVQMAYVTPAHQYPLGYVMSLERRKKLLQWAADCGSYIIEDDYDSEFVYENAPLPSLIALDRHSVIHTGTFSKVLGPGLRLGYMICPPDLAPEIAKRKALLNNGCPTLDQAIMSRFIESGDYVRHVRWLHKIYCEQRDKLIKGLKEIWGQDLQISGATSGMHFAVHLPEYFPDAISITACALQYGVRLYPLSEAACSITRDQSFDSRILLFGYASLDCEAIDDAIDRLRKCFSDGISAPKRHRD